MADELEISKLSNRELLCELKKLGIAAGPITPTTRKVLESRLAKARGFEVANEHRVDSIETRPNSFEPQGSSDEKLPSLFYGVCYDVESPNLSAVFTNKNEALTAAKKVKGSRFKPFGTRREAEEFSRALFRDTVQLPGISSISPKPVGPVSSFKDPKPQELTQFRKLIEQDKRQEVLDRIRSNPKYLVASGDTPSILQVGCRYNALHVAAMCNKKEMCELVIQILESDDFWRIFVQQENSSAVNSNSWKQFLVDRYLNTPDKGVSDRKQGLVGSPTVVILYS